MKHDCCSQDGTIRCFQEDGNEILTMVTKESYGSDGCLPKHFYFTSFDEKGLGQAYSCDCGVWYIKFCPLCGYEAK